MLEVAVIADDLTGAADCAIAFANAGLRTFVAVGEATAPADADAVAVDTDTRRMDAVAAADRTGAAAAWAWGQGARTLYKKLDSTLRGHVGVEIAATLRARARLRPGERALVLLAPAFPAAARTTRSGQVLVKGIPLAQTEVWRDAGQAGPADMLGMMRGAGLSAVQVALAEIRAGPDRLVEALERHRTAGADVAICDAEEEGDLRAIGDAGARLGEGVVWAGSAGLARHLPAALRLERPALAPRAGALGGPVLVVVGSRSSVAREQARALLATGEVTHLVLYPRALLAGPSDPRWPSAALSDALSARRDVLLTVDEESAGLEHGPAIAAAVGVLVAPHRARLGGVVATGGDIARALLGAAGATGLHLSGEVEPGVPVGLANTDPPLPFVSKAGAFGSPETLLRCRDALREPGRSAPRPR